MIRLQVCNVHRPVLWSLLEERHAAASGTKVVDRRGGRDSPGLWGHVVGTLNRNRRATDSSWNGCQQTPDSQWPDIVGVGSSAEVSAEQH